MISWFTLGLAWSAGVLCVDLILLVRGEFLPKATIRWIWAAYMLGVLVNLTGNLLSTSSPSIAPKYTWAVPRVVQAEPGKNTDEPVDLPRSVVRSE